MPIRQPIVVVMGHVDHGKTSLLDCIRKSNVAKKEAGAITQHIGASEITLADIQASCSKIMGGKTPEFIIPGLLFIDTPGHESFTHLRERGGSIADIAVLVVDIAQGFQPQTVESIKILRQFKTPFVVAANKIDLTSGWKASGKEGACGVIATIGAQKPEVQERLDEHLYRVVGKLSEMGIESERFDRVSDFTKQVAIIPVSAKTTEGVPELLLSIAGLSQKFLEKELRIETAGAGKGSVLEVKEEKGLGTTIDVIVYEGTVRKNDEVIFGTMNGPARARIRGLLKPKISGTSDGEKYEYVDEVHAACGVKIYAPGLEGALSGSPILVESGGVSEEEFASMQQLIKEIIFESEGEGVIVKADTLGSLEAMRKLLSASGIQIKRSSVGSIVKKDIIDAALVAAADPYKGVVLAFNVGMMNDVDGEAAKRGVKLFISNVIYALVEDYAKWVEEEKRKASGSAIERLPFPGKILVLPGCTFRASKPAIFGVQIIGGRLKKEVRLMDRNGALIGEVREVQKDGKPAKETFAGEQLAISVEGAICGKSFSEGDHLYAYITRKEADELMSASSDELTAADKAVLEEILAITDKKRI